MKAKFLKTIAPLLTLFGIWELGNFSPELIVGINDALAASLASGGALFTAWQKAFTEDKVVPEKSNSPQV